MKILIINSLYHPYHIGGAEKSVQHLAQLLSDRGNSISVLTTGEKQEKKTINGIEVYYIKSRNLYWFYNVKKRSSLMKLIFHIVDSINLFHYSILNKLIKEIKPQVIHTNNLMGISVMAWLISKRLRIPTVHTLRDFYLLCIKSTMYRNNHNCSKQCFECKILTYPRKILSKRINFVAGISDYILSKHLDLGFFPEIPKGVLYNSFPIFEGQLPRKNLPNNHIVFGCVGQIVKTKGIDLLINTFSRLSNSQLLMYGKIVEDDLYHKLSKVKNIRYCGFQEPSDIFNSIDVLIVPSLWNEPFGRVIVEAFTYGVPVIGSNRGGIPELIKDGINGYIFEPDIKDDLSKILQFLHNNQETIFTLSKNAIASGPRFDENDLIKKYENIYQGI